MAKTIMISNEVYEKLKRVKGNGSFSELFENLLSKNKKKKGIELKSCFGILKRDKEWTNIEKELKRGWKGWRKEYV